MELYLLRHGLSLANEAGLVTGNRQDPLSPAGRERSAAAAGLLRRYGLEGAACFVSDWRRARETAALAAPGLRFAIEPRLGETDAGAAAEWSLEAFNQAHPEFWSSFSPERAYPGGESHAELQARALDWLRETEGLLAPEARVLAVTHAGPICSLLHYVCGVNMARFPMFLAAHASLTKLERRAGGPWRPAFFSLEAPA